MILFFFYFFFNLQPLVCYTRPSEHRLRATDTPSRKPPEETSTTGRNLHHRMLPYPRCSCTHNTEISVFKHENRAKR
ncbi:hypothetical protein I3760_10G093000 [Carya illinoinensis]|nr:hypothetical protein I3760_10G093000 [Carya illinoinensis]